MAEPFKLLINPQTVRDAGAHLQRTWSAFDRQAFEALAIEGLDALEFKARAMRVADALTQTLPADFGQACAVLEASLAPPSPFDAKGEPVSLDEQQRQTGLTGWVLWSAGEYVARHGMGEVPRALACLHALTQRFTAEFAIRPFLQRHPKTTLNALQSWVRDPSPHVRRLVSEGSRPRLPWGLRLHSLVADPTPTLPLLHALQDDPSAYVRRSVANHLNDIAKDHPERVAAWVAEHLNGASPERVALLRHASRTLVKQGHPATLHAWGLGHALNGDAVLALSPGQARIGESVELRVRLASSAREPQTLVVDYAVHHVRANGGMSAKVFKGWKLTLAPGETRELVKRHSLRPVTTRTLYPGTHHVELLVNGKALGRQSFELQTG